MVPVTDWNHLNDPQSFSMFSNGDPPDGKPWRGIELLVEDRHTDDLEELLIGDINPRGGQCNCCGILFRDVHAWRRVLG